jgi:hypothetical protein
MAVAHFLLLDSDKKRIAELLVEEDDESWLRVSLPRGILRTRCSKRSPGTMKS